MVGGGEVSLVGVSGMEGMGKFLGYNVN